MSKKATAFGFDITTTNDRAESIARRQIERGALVAVTLIVQGTVIRKGTAFAVISVRSGGSAAEHTSAILTSGYVYNAKPLYWTGEYILTAQSELIVSVRASVAQNFRLNGTINIEE